MEAALKTPRTARTARPVSATSGRWTMNMTIFLQYSIWTASFVIIKCWDTSIIEFHWITTVQLKRFVRLGTASMLSQADGPFINLARSLSLQYLQNPSKSSWQTFNQPCHVSVSSISFRLPLSYSLIPHLDQQCWSIITNVVCIFIFRLSFSD